MRGIDQTADKRTWEAERLRREAERLRREAERLEEQATRMQLWVDAWRDPTRWVELHWPDLPGLRCGGDCCFYVWRHDCPRHGLDDGPVCLRLDGDFARDTIAGFDPYVVWRATQGRAVGGAPCDEVPCSLEEGACGGASPPSRQI